MTHLRKHLVVVGHGMVGHRFVQAAIERGLTETHDITVIGEEHRPAYDRVALTSFFEVGADALRLQLLGARLDGLALGLQRLEGGNVQEGLRVFAGFQPGDGGGQVFAKKEDIEHRRRF